MPLKFKQETSTKLDTPFWYHKQCKPVVNIYNGIIFPSLNHVKIFESIPDEPWSTSSDWYIKWG